MSFLAIAIFEIKPGKEEECMAIGRELYAYLRAKGYGQDVTYRDAKKPNMFYDIRVWASKELAAMAHQDPEVHKFWGRMAKVSTVRQVFNMEKLPGDEELVI